MRLLLTISSLILLVTAGGYSIVTGKQERFPRPRDDSGQAGNSSALPDTDPRAIVPETKEKALKPKDRGRLQPSTEIAEKYSDYAKRTDGGLFVLLEPEGMTVSAANVKEEPFGRRFRGAGSYYSFLTLQHDADNSAQIRLRHNYFLAGASELTRHVETGHSPATPLTLKMGKSLALFHVLGDLSLDRVTADLPAVRELAVVTVPSRQKEFDNLVTGSETGIEGPSINFRKTVPARANHTYLLRSVIFRKSDLLIVFRVVDRDRDGNLHIIWRKLAGS